MGVGYRGILDFQTTPIQRPSSCPLPTFPCLSPTKTNNFNLRLSAGGSCASRLVGKAAVAASLQSVSPQQLGEGEVLDEDVAREVERIGQRGGEGDGDEDAIKVTWLGNPYVGIFSCMHLILSVKCEACHASCKACFACKA